MFEGMNMSFLPEVMRNAGGQLPVPQAPTMNYTPIATPQQAWYNNPGFWSMIGKFGAALSPKDSWGRDLGLAASAEGQARQYGAGKNKMLGPMLAGETPLPGTVGTELGSVAPTPGATPVGQKSVNPFFDQSPSTSVLSNTEMMGLSPDQIKDIMGTAIEAKKFPLEVARINAGIDYTKASAEHMKALNAETARKAAVEKRREVNFTTEMDEVIKGNIKSKYITPEDARILKAVGPTEAPKLIDNLINLTKETGKKLTIQKVGDEVLFLDSSPDATPGTRIVDRYSVGSDDKGKPENWHYTQGLSVAFTNNYQTLLDAHYKKFGNREEAKRKLDETLGMVNQTTDPQKAESAKSYLLSLIPSEARIKMLEEADAVASSLRSGTGLAGAYRKYTPQGADETLGILGYRKPVPKENQFMLEGLPKGEPTPFDSILNRYFEPGDIPMAKEAMKRESSGNPRAKNINKNGTADYGLFQINEVNVPELRKAGIINEVTDLYDADTNIVAASYLKKKYGWKPWKSSLGSLAEGKTASMKVPAGTTGMYKGKKVRMTPDGKVEYVK